MTTKRCPSTNCTYEQYTAMLEAQHGVCAICHQECLTGKSLAVDHDRATGKVRGLLCHCCNQGLGWLNDSPQLLLAAWSYLREHSDS